MPEISLFNSEAAIAISDKYGPKINAIEKSIDEAKTKLNSHDDGINDLQNQFNELEASLNNMKASLEAHDSRLNNVSKNVFTIMDDVSDLSDEITDTDNRLTIYNGRLKNITTAGFISCAVMLVFFITLIWLSNLISDFRSEIDNLKNKVETSQSEEAAIAGMEALSNGGNTKVYDFGIAQIGGENQPRIIYDKETKVMYIISDNGNYTTMLNEDGTPRLYIEE